MPGAPQPPSLDLPERVTDLSAVRTGDHVALTWTMPKRDTDKVALKGNVTVRVCRNESADQNCSVAASFELSGSADGTFADTLPGPLAQGTPRVITYFVELDNRRGRSAGLSNGAQVVAGEAPAVVDGLAAEMRRDGVLLHWTPAPPDATLVAIRLVRHLVSPPANQPVAAQSAKATIAPHTESTDQNLLVEPDPHGNNDRGRALDGSIEFGATYEYRVQRVARVNIDGKTLELAGALSAPVRIAAVNVFPPAVPKGLAAVATMGEAGAEPAIDLNWQPNTEADLAGYIVYRREADASQNEWQRISPEQPIVAPGYHDATVQGGHTYVYAVSSVDEQGHESARSAEAEETVPAQ